MNDVSTLTAASAVVKVAYSEPRYSRVRSEPVRPATISAARCAARPPRRARDTAWSASSSAAPPRTSAAPRRARSRPSAPREALRELRGRAAHDLLEALRQLAAHGDRPLGIAAASDAQRRRQPLRRLERDRGYGQPRSSPQTPASSPARARQETEELVPPADEPARDERRLDRRRPGQHGHRHPGVERRARRSARPDRRSPAGPRRGRARPAPPPRAAAASSAVRAASLCS